MADFALNTNIIAAPIFAHFIAIAATTSLTGQRHDERKGGCTPSGGGDGGGINIGGGDDPNAGND